MVLFIGIYRRAIPRNLNGLGLFIETSQPFFRGANEAAVLNVRLAPRYLEAREDQEERVEASAVHHFPFAFGPSSTVLSMAPEYAADNPVEVLRIYRTNGKTFHPPGW